MVETLQFALILTVAALPGSTPGGTLGDDGGRGDGTGKKRSDREQTKEIAALPAVARNDHVRAGSSRNCLRPLLANPLRKNN